MSREWKPGDVSMSDSGIGLVVRVCFNRAHSDGAHWHYVDGGWNPIDTTQEHRPLVVLDPENDEDVQRTLEAVTKWSDRVPYSDMREDGDLTEATAMQAALRELADPTPPRIDEPGTWGVVTAECVHSGRRRTWVRHDDGNWWPTDGSRNPDDWDSLIDPVQIREGMPS